MRIPSFLLIINILLLNSCGQNTRLPQFSFNDSTYLKFHIKNCRTPGSFTVSYVSICPLEQNDIDISYKKDTTGLIKLLVNNPVTINLGLSDLSANCFNLPKDTLDIFIDFSPLQRQKISFKGKCASISNYLTYYKYNIASVPKNFQSVGEYTSQVDNLIRKALFELHSFDSKTPLPDWFVKMEVLDIKYSGARDKVYQFKMRRRFNFKYQFIPDDYLENLDVRLNNPKAKFSLSYYGFLNHYSTLNFYNYLGRQNISTNDAYLFILENIKTTQRFLHSDIKEIYIAQRICALLSKPMVRQALDNNDQLYFQRVDSLINNARDSFNDDRILNALIDYQNRQFRLDYY